MRRESTRAGRRRPASASGAALVIVLSILVLLAALVIMLLSRAGAERKAASSFGAGANARQLADLAVNVVQGQIHTATTGGTTNAWASQPGMIRTYNTQGDLSAAYKLYSAGDMVAGAVDMAADLPPPEWKASPGVWTDLNDPVRLPYSFTGGDDRPLVYPILDPRAAGTVGSVDPVAGFSITNVPGGGVDLADAAPGNNPAPMPVRWLYVLQNGRLAVPSGQDGSVVTFTGSDAPSESNPIVGRVAFWTDDETCKVNLNTAGEGTYWDTPRLSSTDEVNLAFYQPTRNEWQRYPGHPGTTSLSAVFPWQDLPANKAGHQFEWPDDAEHQQKEAVRRATLLSPVYLFGGSEAATRTWTNVVSGASDTYFQNAKLRERLYASMDELIFDDDRDDSSSARGSTNMLFQPSLSVARELLESRRFFLTAHSRAPEINLFNLPRVAIWPVFKLSGTNFNMTRTTAFDRQIARTATIDGQPYFFQRENALASNDLAAIERNVDLLEYLDRLTSRSVPGFGGAFSEKYAQADRRQLLVSIYDYIRSVNLFDELLFDPSNRSLRLQENVPTFTAGYLPVNDNIANTRGQPGHGMVYPSVYKWDGITYRGYGRYMTVTEFGFLFICTADGSAGASTWNSDSSSTVDPEPTDDSIPPGAILAREKYKWESNNAGGNPDSEKENLTLGGTSLQPDEIRVQFTPLVELFTAMQGAIGLIPRGKIEISGLDGISVEQDGATVATGLFPAKITVNFPTGKNAAGNFNITAVKRGLTFDRLDAAGFMGFRLFSAAARESGDAAVSAPFTLKNTTPDFSVQAGNDVIIRLFPDENSADSHSIEISAAQLSATLPLPRLFDRMLDEESLERAGHEQDKFYLTPGASYQGDGQIKGIIANYIPRSMAGSSPDTPPYRYWAFTDNQILGYEDEEPKIEPTNQRNLGRFATLIERSLPSGHPDRSRLQFWYYPGIPLKPVGDEHRDVSGQGSGAFILDGYDQVMTTYPSHGDFRLIFAKEGFDGFESGGGSHTLRDAHATGHVPGTTVAESYGGPSVHEFRRTDLSLGFAGPNHPSLTGDWDNGYSVVPDGPYINKPDEGNSWRGRLETADDSSGYSSNVPYFEYYSQLDGAYATFSSPNRMMPSAGMFGSLPSGAQSGVPWRTLLFRPQSTHFGWTAPRDHLILDLFWMPTVEPYSISEPFSTAGKINLNYQILPFTYIERATGIWAILKNERLGVIPDTHAPVYKANDPGSWPNNRNNSSLFRTDVRGVGKTRRTLNIPEILKQFRYRFSRGEIFRSATEICEVHMVPTGESVPGDTPPPTAFDAWASGFWGSHRLTGENMRERIYTTVYPRVTTKSNTFTVHVQAQALKQPPGGDPSAWDESRGSVAGEYRGSTTLERFVDPNNASIPDYATGFEAGVASLDSFYRWRVVQNRQFAP